MSGGKKQQKNRRDSVKNWRFHVLPPRFAAELFRSELFGMPAEDFSREDRTITPDSDFVGIEVRPLARLRSRETAQHLALGIDLQDTARYGVGHVQEVVGSDHQAKGMPEFPLPQEAPAGIEDLDARVLPVTDIDEITVNGDGMRGVELSRPGALHSPAQQLIAVLVELQHPRIPVAIRDVNVAVAIPSDVGWLIEMQNIISRNAHPPQSEQHPPFGAQLQNHMRTDVGSPDVVLGIDANHMRGHEQVVGNAADEFAGGVEFHKRMFPPVED